jgi:hypothetical protein
MCGRLLASCHPCRRSVNDTAAVSDVRPVPKPLAHHSPKGQGERWCVLFVLGSVLVKVSHDRSGWIIQVEQELISICIPPVVSEHEIAVSDAMLVREPG